jgi:hypothetical protein
LTLKLPTLLRSSHCHCHCHSFFPSHCHGWRDRVQRPLLGEPRPRWVTA